MAHGTQPRGCFGETVDFAGAKLRLKNLEETAALQSWSLQPSSAVPVDRLRFRAYVQKYRANSEDYAKENYAKLKTIAGEVAEWLNAAVC